MNNNNIKNDNNFNKISQLLIQDDFNEPTYYLQKLKFKSIPKTMCNLGKFRLTSLVVFTTLGGYILASPSTFTHLFPTCLGVFLCSISANTFNHYLEYPFDSQMKRTSSRILPMSLIKPDFVFLYALITAFIGTYVLYTVNSLTAILGLSNIILYAFIYTPMKRFTLYNTHIGSLVGAIPPLIGWIGATSTINLSALMLCAILFSWQFIHFNSLSYHLREDYCKTGYQMMVNVNINKLRRSTVLHSLIVAIICLFLPSIGLHKLTFISWTLIPNLMIIQLSLKFYLNPNQILAKKLFYMSLVQITVIITAIIVSYIFTRLQLVYKNNRTSRIK